MNTPRHDPSRRRASTIAQNGSDNLLKEIILLVYCMLLGARTQPVISVSIEIKIVILPLLLRLPAVCSNQVLIHADLARVKALHSTDATTLLLILTHVVHVILVVLMPYSCVY
jgi:hypothetical protein